MKMTRVAWVLAALLVFFAAQVGCAAFEANATTETDIISGGTDITKTFDSSGGVPLQTVLASANTVCWRWTKKPPFSSISSLGARAYWSMTVEWCGNNKAPSNGGKVKSMPYKRCFDWGGGIFTYDPPVVECSRTPLDRTNVRVEEVLKYHGTIWIPPGIPVTITRFAHASVVFGPRGGVSGSWWWST